MHFSSEGQDRLVVEVRLPATAITTRNNADSRPGDRIRKACAAHHDPLQIDAIGTAITNTTEATSGATAAVVCAAAAAGGVAADDARGAVEEARSVCSFCTGVRR